MRSSCPASEPSVEEVGPFGRIYTVRAPRAPSFDRRYRLILPAPAICRCVGGPIGRILEREQPDLVEVCDKYSLCYLAALLRRAWLPARPPPVLVGLSCERFDDNWRLSRSRLGPRAPSPAGTSATSTARRSTCTSRTRNTPRASCATPCHDRRREFVHVCADGRDADGFGPERRIDDDA